MKARLAMAVVALGGAGVALRADVVYRDLPDTVITFGGVQIDLDDDGVVDVTLIGPVDCPAGCSARAVAASGNGVVGDASGFAAAVPAGTAIGSGSSFLDNARLASAGFSGCTAGAWCTPGPPQFLGVRFDRDGRSYYGWVRIQNQGSIQNLVSLDVAYESVPGVAIAAGAGLPAVCYANCDASTAAPFLNVNDFICFQMRFASGEAYANCDGSTAAPVLNVNDFICFQTAFAAGCSAP